MHIQSPPKATVDIHPDPAVNLQRARMLCQALSPLLVVLDMGVTRIGSSVILIDARRDTEDTVSEDTVSEDTVSEDTVSEDSSCII